MASLNTMTKNVCRTFDYVAAVCFFMMMAVGVANIFLRALFHNPLTGTVELVGVFSAIGISAALAYSAYNNAQISVSFVIEKMPERWQKVIDVLIYLISFVFWGTAVFFVLHGAVAASRNHLITASWHLPHAPIMGMVAVGLVLLCLVFIVKIQEILVPKAR